MNRWTLVFTLSLAVNLALLSACWVRRAPMVVAEVDGAVEPSIPGGAAAIDGRTWARLQAVDDVAFVGALAEAGFPSDVRRALVRARVHERFATRREAIVAAMPVAYWKSRAGGRSVDPATRAAWAALAREESAELRRVLGPEAESALSRRVREVRYGALSVEKIDALERLNADYGELISDLREEAFGLTMPGDAERIDLLTKEKREDLARLLSPEELAAYDERSSPSALSVKRMLADFEVTEAEFRQLYALQKDFDERYDGAAPARRRTTVGVALLKEQMGALFPAERAAAFAVVSDGAYLPVASLVDRLSLPRETTRAVVSYARTAQATMQQIARDASLTAEQRRDALEALHAESVAQLAATLGPEGFEAYTEASWLKNLESQRAAAASAAKPK